jgi:anti-sigma factor RsiW
MIDHPDLEQWLASYRDGELSPEEEAAVEAHLATCPECTAHDSAARNLSRTMRQATRHRAPPGLADRIRAALPAEAASPGETPSAPGPARAPATVHVLPDRRPRRWIASAAAAAACVLLAWNLTLQLRPAPAPSLVDQVVDDHIRALMVNHLTDVLSSDQHTVKPWFNGKLDLAPPVGDFPDQGFALVGGRLDYLSGHSVAALVYRHNEHVINVFVLPGAGMDSAPHHLTSRGYALLTWAHQGLGYWAVSDINAPELDTLATLINSASQPQQPE